MDKDIIEGINSSVKKIKQIIKNYFYLDVSGIPVYIFKNSLSYDLE